MSEGFKLLDAYVEVTASGKGLADKVAKDFEAESPTAARRSSASFGSNLLSGFHALPSVGGGLAKRVGDDFEKAAPEAANRSSSSFGSKLLGGMGSLKSVGSTGASLFGAAFTGVIGGLVGGVTSFVISSFTNTVSAVGSMITNIGQYVAETVIDFSSQLQNANIGFTTMLGSAEKAQSYLADLQKFALKTPFEFGDLTSYAQMMIGYGVSSKSVIPYLTGLGDAAAGAGKSSAALGGAVLAFSQMAARGKVDLGDLNQMTNAGIPAVAILADKYNVSKGKLMDMIGASKIASSDALPKLISGIEHGTKSTAAMGGMMDKMSGTFTGAVSNIQDGLKQALSGAFKPFFDVATKGMLQLGKSLTGKPAKDFVKDVSTSLKPLAKSIDDWFSGIDIDKVFKDAGNAVEDAIPAMTSFGKDVLPDIVKAFGEIGKAAPKVTKAVTAISKSVADAAPGWIEFAGNVASASTDFDKSLNKMSESTHSTSDAFDSFLNDAGKNIHGFVDDAVGTLKNMRSGVEDALSDAGHWLQDAGKNIIDGLVGGINDRIGTVTDAIGHVADLVKGVFTGPKGIDSHSPSKVFEQYGRWINQGLQKGLLGSVDEVKTASNTLSDAVKSAFSTTNMTGSQEAGALKQIKHVTKELVSDAKARDKAVSALADAKDKLAGLKSDKASYGSDIRSNLRSGFEVGTLFGNGASDMATYMDSKADYASRMADYNKGLAGAQSDYAKGLADAQLADSRSSRGASVGTLDGHGYTASYSTQGGGTAVADFLRDNGSDPSAKFKADNELPTDTSGKKPLTGVARIKADLKKLLTDTKAFTANLKTLVKMGMDKTTLQQLIDAGPTAGLDITKDMIADPAGLKAIVGIQNDLYKAGTGLGAWASGQMYDSQIADATQLVNDDKGRVTYQTINMTIDASKIDDITKMMNALKALSKTAKAAKVKK